MLEEFGLNLLSLCTMKIRQRNEAPCSRLTSVWVRVARRNPLVISPGKICTYITRSAVEGSTNSQLKCFVAHNTLRPIYRAELENSTKRKKSANYPFRTGEKRSHPAIESSFLYLVSLYLFHLFHSAWISYATIEQFSND